MIGKQDKQPIQHVDVRIFPKTDPKVWPPEFRTGSTYAFQTQTDQQGQWSIVIPRVDPRIIATGYAVGYELGSDHGDPDRYSQTCDIPRDGKSIDVPDFEIVQIPTQSVSVVDEQGRPIANAEVAAWQDKWLTDEFVMRESLASPETTNDEGNCVLTISESSWTTGNVFAEYRVNNVTYLGRAAIDRNNNQPVVVRVEKPIRIRGTLSRNGSPAAGVELVLYELLKSERGWKAIAMKGTDTTDAAGRFVFPAESGIPHVIALNQRDANGVQPTLHRITEPDAGVDHVVPDIDIASITQTK